MLPECSKFGFALSELCASMRPLFDINTYPHPVVTIFYIRIGAPAEITLALYFDFMGAAVILHISNIVRPASTGPISDFPGPFARTSRSPASAYYSLASVIAMSPQLSGGSVFNALPLVHCLSLTSSGQAMSRHTRKNLVRKALGRRKAGKEKQADIVDRMKGEILGRRACVLLIYIVVFLRSYFPAQLIPLLSCAEVFGWQVKGPPPKREL